MTEKKIKWTDQQQTAITARDSDVLVTASAGTGKTAVLAGRAVDIVSDKSICPDVSNILVITFTDAAAEQMRSRIADYLQSAFNRTKNQHLYHQLLLLAAADISTIHSFCKRLITEYFYRLDIDPTFRVIDDDEQKLLKAEVLEKTIDWAWQQPNLQQDLRSLLYHRDLRTDEGFFSNIIDLSNFLDCIVSRQDWLSRALLLADDPSGLADRQKKIISKKLTQILHQITFAISLYAKENPDGSWMSYWDKPFIKTINDALSFLNKNKWDKAFEILNNYQKPSKYNYTPRDIKGPLKDVIADLAKASKSDFEKIFGLALLNPEYLEQMNTSVRPQVRLLVALVRKFDRLYEQAKKTINCLDFSDLQHYALKLLTDPNSPKPAPSDVALALRRRYKHIFVDEYQDIDLLQQAILERLSSGRNVFVVGDIKQSIYAFRGAQPDIFLQRLAPAVKDPRKAAPSLRVDLTANWRSNKEILDFVNKIFGRIMSASFAGLTYDQSSRLTPAEEQNQPPAVSPAVEFNLLDEEIDYDEFSEESDSNEKTENHNPPSDSYSARQRQAALIANLIKQFTGPAEGKPYQIYDKQLDKFRPVEYRDIVILMRSPAQRVNDYLEILRLAGVPSVSDTATGYFAATEITDMLCLLKVLDNPRQDIELAAVLRSPIFRISDTELACVKLAADKEESLNDFYEKVVWFASNGPDKNLRENLSTCLDTIEKWRTISRSGSLADLIWQIFRQTGYLSFVSALPAGQLRRANLLKLHDRAIQFEGFASNSPTLSLSRFVDFINRLQQSGADWAPAEPLSAAENAVRIISVHKSKGLEFPVVILAELNNKFNTQDTIGDCLSDPEDTIGLQLIDPVKNTRINSLAHQVISDKKYAASLAEEMRILYVAATRAKDKLILVASADAKKCSKIVSVGSLVAANPVPDWLLSSCKSHLEWLLYALCDQKSIHTGLQTSLENQAIDENLFQFKLYKNSELVSLNDCISNWRKTKSHPSRKAGKAGKPQQVQLINALKNSLNWQYESSAVSKLPAKRSISQLTHGSDEFRRFDYSRALERTPSSLLSADLPLTVDSRIIGTATHLLISQLDLTSPVTIEKIENTRKQLFEKGFLTEQTASLVDAQAILAFFKSPLGSLALDKSNTVWREWPFTFSLPAGQLADSAGEQTESGEFIVIQGIIDMLIKTTSGLIVIDFKTDKVSSQYAQKHVDNYRQQLNFYSLAASGILNIPILSKWLFFLSPRTPVELQ